jgi:hypothetical protein
MSRISAINPKISEFILIAVPLWPGRELLAKMFCLSLNYCRPPTLEMALERGPTDSLK